MDELVQEIRTAHRDALATDYERLIRRHREAAAADRWPATRTTYDAALACRLAIARMDAAAKES